MCSAGGFRGSDITGKGGLMAELKMAPTSWGQSPHFVERGEAGKQAPSLRAAWTPCVVLRQSIGTS